jgi:hypothetical protein
MRVAAGYTATAGTARGSIASGEAGRRPLINCASFSAVSFSGSGE